MGSGADARTDDAAAALSDVSPPGQTDAARDASHAADATLLPALRDDAVGPMAWKAKVERVLDTSALDAYFADVGYTPPAGTAAYAVRIVEGAGGPGYQFYDAADGAFDMSFWPASTIKLLAALAALEWVYAQGYTGAARVDWDSGFGDVLRAIYERSIGVSSNIDYDRTLRAAGWDFTNATFLTPERGFPRTVITGSYASVEVRNPGGYTLTEGANSTYVPARAGLGEYGRNDTDLYELVEGVRRLMLDAEIPQDERFRIDPADVAAVQVALCGATPSYFAAGAAAALGGTPTICHKPGWVPDNECLDHGLVTAPDGARYLIAASIPYQANCPGLGTIARHMLAFLQSAPTEGWLQADHGEVVIQSDPGLLTIQTAGADEVIVWADRAELGRSDTGDRGRHVIAHDATGPAFVRVLGLAQGAPVAFRTAEIQLW